MLNYRLSSAEQETTLTYTRTDAEAVMYTSDRLRMAKMDKLCQQHPEAYRCIWIDDQILGDGLPMAKRYSVPVKLLRFAKPATEAQKAAGRRNLARISSKP